MATSILSKLRSPRSDSGLGNRLGTHYANQECPPFTDGLDGRYDYMSQISTYGKRCLSSQDSYARLLPQSGITYGERVDGMLPTFNDGSTATIFGGDVAHPTRDEYELNLAMSRTLPTVDSITGIVRNDFHQDEMNLYPPRGTHMRGPDITEPQIPVARRYAPRSGLDLSDFAYDDVKGDDATRDINFMAVVQKAPISVVRTSLGGPGVGAPLGAVSRKNALYNAKLAQMKARGPY